MERFFHDILFNNRINSSEKWTETGIPVQSCIVFATNFVYKLAIVYETLVLVL